MSWEESRTDLQKLTQPHPLDQRERERERVNGLITYHEVDDWHDMVPEGHGEVFRQTHVSLQLLYPRVDLRRTTNT